MSRTVDLFIASALGAHDLAARLGTLLGGSFQPATFLDGRPRLAYDTDEVAVDLAPNEFENDRDLLFERYNHHLRIQGRRTARSPEEAEASARRWARELFERLREEGDLPLLLVDDGQRKLDEFRP